MDANTIIESYLIENGFEDLKNYEGFYKINKKGDIWSCIYKKIKKPHENEGYMYVHLSKHNTRYHTSIHRLLAIQYISNPEQLPEVDHIDRNKTNNNLENLRWADKIIQNNNKSNCIHLKTEDEQAERLENIKEYKRCWAEKNRREKGVLPSGSKQSTTKEYKSEWMAKKRAEMTEEEKKKVLEHRRELYAQKEQTEDQKEAAKERAKKQREAIKADPEKQAQQREYKRLKAQEYREKKKQQQQQS